MRASIRKNQLKRTKTFMRKRAYFSKEGTSKEDFEIHENLSDNIEPDEIEEEKEEAEGYQENMLQTLKKNHIGCE